MNAIDLLESQTQNAYNWVNRLIEPVSHDKWDVTPEVLNTNISWQVVHLISSFYFHTIMSVKGHNKEVLQKVPLKDYSEKFSLAPAKNIVGQTNASEIFTQLKFMQSKSIETIKSLSVEDLAHELESMKIKHPVANTKFEVIDWNIKHTMWHCGQIATLKREIDQRYAFGLEK